MARPGPTQQKIKEKKRSAQPKFPGLDPKKIKEKKRFTQPNFLGLGPIN
jgi:hypothetical protein